MTTIAKLTKQKDGGFGGTLLTLTVMCGITIKPEKSDNPKAPAYRVLINVNDTDFEIGAGWKKTSKAGNDYVALKIDDPAFAQPLYCALRKVEDGYVLDWNRQQVTRGAKRATGDQASEF
jgi:uncharacterized protein (DUF736 family)